MCGIIALIGPQPNDAKKCIQRGMRNLAHRGPHDEGLLQGKNWSVGHTRLCIRSKATTGRQPFSKGNQHLCFNGEIHNYRELAECLVEADPTWADYLDGSDTAVAFAAIAHWGTDAFDKFRGQWAIAWIDESTQSAILARDRYGKKPLCYASYQNCLAVASEAHALPGPSAAVSRRAITDFVVTGHYPAAPDSFFPTIKQLAPGAVCKVSLQCPIIEVSASPPRGITVQSVPSFEEAALQLRELLASSVNSQAQSLGETRLLLSAGKDSATLASLYQGGALTYSSGGPSDESQEVLEWYGQERSIEVAQPSRILEFQDRFQAISKTLDAPVASASLLALDSLFKTALDAGCRVLLSGQGADELLGGYHYYSLLQPRFSDRVKAALEIYGGLYGAFKQARRARAAVKLNQELEQFEVRLDLPRLDARMKADFYGAPLQSMLWYEDRIAMRHGVEVRYPFLARDIVELLQSCPPDFHVQGKTRKRLLAAAFENSWPLPLKVERQKRGLPADAAGIILENRDFFKEGIYTLSRKLGLELRPAKTALQASPNVLTPVAIEMWRLSAAGHFIAERELVP